MIDKENRSIRTPKQITATSLGSNAFKKEYNLQYPYLIGGMYRGISSKEMIIKIAKAGMMGFYGTGTLHIPRIEKEILAIKDVLGNKYSYGMNFLHNPMNPGKEDDLIELFLKHGIKNIEASAFMQITPALVRYRISGLKKNENSYVLTNHKVIAKISRPEVAEMFLSPAPERIVNKLLEENKITNGQAAMSVKVPVADDICVEADSGGHTDQGVAYALMPSIIKMRDRMMGKYGYQKKVRVGAAGGIGTPEAAAAAFILGADFILTGSINQCTIEAGTSPAVKDMLNQANVQDTGYAPAGDMFEIGARVQVLKKGTFFSARANKLYDLYMHHTLLEEIDEKTKEQLQKIYFKKSFEDVWEETKSYFKSRPGEIEKAEQNPKYKMGLIFRWYFNYTTNLAINGIEDQSMDYQVHCGPALGAFNQWVKGTDLENWKNRHVDVIAIKIMEETADLLNKRYEAFLD